MVSSQRSLHTAVRSASSGLTLLPSQCMPGPYAPCLDDTGVGTLCAATANGPSLLLKARIVHQVFALLQVMHLGIKILYSGMVCEQPTDFL